MAPNMIPADNILENSEVGLPRKGRFVPVYQEPMPAPIPAKLPIAPNVPMTLNAEGGG